MKKHLLLFGIVLCSFYNKPLTDPYEEHSVPSIEAFQQKFTLDTTARAVVLNETGRAAIIK